LLGAARIGRPELWRDELRSWSAATRSVDELFHLLGNTDAAVGLYYLALHYWISIFGDSVTAMRLLSVVMAAAAAGVVALIGQRLFNRRTAVIGGLIFALIPAVSRFAQEVRPYAMAILIAVIATLLLLRGIEKPSWPRLILYGCRSWWRWPGCGVPILLAHAVGLVLWRRNQPVLRWVLVVTVGLTLAAPVALLSSGQYAHQVGSLPNATVGELTRLPPRLFASGLVAGALIILDVLAWTENWRPAAFATAWAVLPIAAIWVASMSATRRMSRYMLFTLPAFALLAGAAIARLRTRLALAVVLVLAMLGVQDQRTIRAVESHEQWTYPDTGQPFINYTALGDIVSKYYRPGDAVVYANRSDYFLLDIGLAYHMRGHEMPPDIFVKEPAVQRGDFWPEECELAVDCLKGVQRVWVVSIGVRTQNALEEMESDKRVMLRTTYRIQEEWYPSSIDIWLMERKASAP
jgi:mannosyltransferase